MKHFIYRVSRVEKDQLQIEKEKSINKIFDEVKENYSELTQQINGRLMDDTSTQIELMTWISFVPFREAVILKKLIEKLQGESYDKDEIIEELKTLTFEKIYI